MHYNIPISKDILAYDIIPASVPFLITLPHRYASHQTNILFISVQISAGETEDTTSWMFISYLLQCEDYYNTIYPLNMHNR